ncbi:MAG TPA: glutamate racemase [Candidatus Sulfopaludibacter sp.]|jgi:glutamate racemase|nr:glutamate racemase [Candidatus Sulfopaludibacter sp.]
MERAVSTLMMVKSPLRHAIGVFDSGVGGLTVLQALRRRMPHRDFVYLGDTARVPYGRKPPEMVVEFASGIARFLCEMGAEGLVVACNTASAVALPGLADRCDVPVWGVIDPGVEAATRATRTGSVGVIGTKAAMASGAYQSRLEQRGLCVWAQACPMLVHLVEEGLAHSPEAELLVRHYLSGRPEIDTLVLGCTHYPLLRSVIQRVVGKAVTLVDSAEVTAERVEATLGAPPRCFVQGRVVHFVTGDPLAFTHTANVIGGVEGEIVPLPLSELSDASSTDGPAEDRRAYRDRRDRGPVPVRPQGPVPARVPRPEEAAAPGPVRAPAIDAGLE